MIVPPAEIQVNDLYCSAADGLEWLVIAVHPAFLQNLRAIRCEELQPAQYAEPLWILQCQHEDKERSWQIHSWQALADLALPVAIKRLTLCGQPACWKHYREIADGVYRCQDHWMVGSEEPMARTETNRLRRPKAKRKQEVA